MPSLYFSYALRIEEAANAKALEQATFGFCKAKDKLALERSESCSTCPVTRTKKKGEALLLLFSWAALLLAINFNIFFRT